MLQDAQRDAQSLVGQVLADTYRLEELLATGGMGAVYRGRHVRTGGLCAVKVLHKDAAHDSEIYQRFIDEARIISALRHPYIVQVTDLDHAKDGTPFIVMELLQGEDLEDRLIRQVRLPIKQVLKMSRQIGTAMQAAHELGIVHRDLKPTNIYLARHRLGKASVEIIKIIDFGVSKIPRPEGKATRNLLVLGTPKYVAPEGAQGWNAEMDGRADQFSLAVILYRCLSGRLPFEQEPGESLIDLLRKIAVEPAPSLVEFAPGVPRHVVAAIERAMSKEKDQRFPTIMDFVQALEGTAPGAPGRETQQRLRALDTTAQHMSPVRWSRVVPAAMTGIALGLVALYGMNRLLLRGPQQLQQQHPQPPPPQQQDPETQALQRSFEDALGKGDLPGALRLFRGLPQGSPLRAALAEPAEAAAKSLLQMRLEAAEAARRENRCKDARARAREALELAPRDLKALDTLWGDCGAQSFVQPPAWGYKLIGYPPLRISARDTDPPPPPPGQEADQVLRLAELAFADGKYQRTLELAHSVIMTDRLNYMRTYRLLGAGACALGKVELARRTYDRLDATSREFLAESCQQRKVSLP